jgi:hypothetical protein
MPLVSGQDDKQRVQVGRSRSHRADPSFVVHKRSVCITLPRREVASHRRPL